MTAHEEQPVIVACPDGPLLVRGHIDLTAPDGTPASWSRSIASIFDTPRVHPEMISSIAS